MRIKEIAKSTMRWCHTIQLAPLIAVSKLGNFLPGDNYFFEYSATLLALAPGLIGRNMRNAFYHHTLKRCGKDVRVCTGAFFWSPDAEVGNHVAIGHYSTIGRCTIGDDVLIAGHVSIHDGVEQHGSDDLEKPISEQKGKSKPVTIGNGCWIGDGAKVAANVGEKSIVGIGAVVLRDMPEAVVVLGNPARVVSHRKNPIKKKTQ